MARIRINCFDILIFSSIAYAVSDLVTNWDNYSLCKYPMNYWLLISYSLTVLIRTLHFIGHYLSYDDDEVDPRDMYQDPMRTHFNWKNDRILKAI